MKNNNTDHSYIKGLIAAMNHGTVSVPYLLITHYASLKLSETEAMLLIHLSAFKEKEQNDFPTLEELQARMSCEPSSVANMLQKLTKQQFIAIDEGIDSQTGVLFEQYNLQPLYEKLAHCYAEQQNKIEADLRLNEQARHRTGAHGSTVSLGGTVWVEESEKSKNIFSIFEKEFARLLSPMEYETISSWLDDERYNEELILLALKESVFAGKLHLRYIDRILFEWGRNRIKTVEQAKQYTQNFRQR